MRIRPDCARLPWLIAGVAIVAFTVPFFLPSPRSWSSVDAWRTYLVLALISSLLFVLAYLDWRCHRERLIASMPPTETIRLLAQLREGNGWAGSPAQFNRYASSLLYGRSFAELLTNPTDYYSSLMADGFIEITGVTDKGNQPDGTPDTMVTVQLTPKAHKVLNDAQSNFVVQRPRAHGARRGR